MVEMREGVSGAGIRRLPILQVVATTFTVFGRAPAFFLACSLVAALPSLVRLALLGAGAQTLDLSAAIVGIVGFLLAYFFQAAMTSAAARLQESGDLDMGDALRVALRRFLPLVGTGILLTLAFSLGFLLLIIPGLILLCIFAVTTPVCVLELFGPVDSMRRSGLLTKGARWRILGLYALFFLPITIVSLLNAFVLMRSGHRLAGLGVNAALSVLWAPFATIFGTALYVELRRLKDHVSVATVFD